MRALVIPLTFILTVAWNIAHADQKTGGSTQTQPTDLCEKEKVNECNWVDDGKGGQIRKCTMVERCRVTRRGGGGGVTTSTGSQPKANANSAPSRSNTGIKNNAPMPGTSPTTKRQ